MTPPNRAYAVLPIPAKLRIEMIRRRPPNITCTSKHTRNAGGLVVTNSYITIVHDTTQKKHICNNDSNEPRYKWIQYKDPNNNGKQNSIQVRTRVQIRLRVLKITNGVHPLPRPSRKGNLANIVKHKPSTKATCAKKKRGRSE